MAEDLNLYQKLAKTRTAVEVVQKDASGYGYNYVSEPELLAKITGSMKKYGVSLIPTVVPGTTSVSPYHYTKTKKGITEDVYEILVSCDMVFTWVNDSDPDERIDVPWTMVGQQSDASQSFGSGLTYAYRYFLLKYFGVATPDDDPDEWRKKQKEAEQEEDRLIAEQITADIDEAVRAYIAANEDAVQTVKKFMNSYIKGGKYRDIKDSATAMKLLADFKDTFLKEG